MLAKHRLEYHIQFIKVVIALVVPVSGKITVDPHPVHFMCPHHFTLTYYCHVIFCGTGYAARATSNTGIKIDTHSPFWTGIREIGIKGSFYTVIA